MITTPVGAATVTGKLGWGTASATGAVSPDTFTIDCVVYLHPFRVVCTITINWSSAAAFSLGSHSVTVKYSGDARYGGSTSAAITQTIAKVKTTTRVLSVINPAVVGQNLVLATTVVPASYPSGVVPGGTLKVLVDGTQVGAALPIVISATPAAAPAGHPGSQAAGGGHAAITPDSFSLTIRCTWSPLHCTITIVIGTGSAFAVGSHTVVVVYSGDARFAGSRNPAITQQIVKG